ncbi:DNA polymerase III subunit beta [candidate division WWE3 bacterium CG10_big_fil_rev_8_21_14_0_10_32_10]|uniref:Beta sliding clamp n=1 Tax=candidate division WWE3 bacterium CG10_big_fil_rev_8_21_14_0_10_32_10 TaxID=1975090 RepID=A0A2H0RBT7_UNCKA|nr:MAG: DNA polymerase III subunit beta [candidate division WWE3 bacterium CG10_big_fil_rev_8_21_14_0_10_32_10]
MKFEVLREHFSRALSLANKAISVKASLPILQNVLLESDSGRLKVVATDLDKSIVTWVGAKIDEEGKITVPAKALYNFVNGLKEDRVVGEITGNNLKLKTAKTQAIFNGTSASEYPLLDYVVSDNHFLVNSNLLKKAVDETYFSSSVDDSSNPEWTGILLKKLDNDIHFVGLDGFRLSKKTISLSDLSTKKIDFDSVIIPAKNFLEVIRMSPNDKDIKIDVQPAKSTVVFDLDDLFFVSKILDGEFPDYDKVIPSNEVTSFTLNYEDFLNAVKLSSIFAHSNTNAIRLNVNISTNNVEVLSDDVELGSNRFEIPITEPLGEDIKVAFNAKYLLDYLNNVPSDTLSVKISGQNSPALFIPTGRTDYVHVAVPLQPYWE